MAGLGGVFGDDPGSAQHLIDYILFESQEISDHWIHDNAGIVSSVHQVQKDDFHFVGKDAELWLWGEPYSHRVEDEYRSRTEHAPSKSVGAYVHEIIEDYGIRGVSRLNGQFSGIYFDKDAQDIHIFLDRVGSRPLYYYRPNEKLILSSNIHAFESCSELSLELSNEHLVEFMMFGRSLGTTTPIEDVHSLPPASISTYNLDDRTFTTQIYWKPEYSKRKKSSDYFARRVAEIFEEIFQELQDPDREDGLLLSGGSDSRLLADFPDNRLACFHMNDWMDREAKAAKDVCRVTNNEFRFLERDGDHYERVLNRGGQINNFTSWFEQGHVLGYDNVEWPDRMLTGLFSDAILGGYFYPKRKSSLPVLKNYKNLPLAQSISSVEQYIDSWSSGEYGRLSVPPTYLSDGISLHNILSDNISENDGYVNHSIEYNAMRDMLVTHGFYPVKNNFTFFMYESMNQITPTISPYLDHRIIDLALEMPISHHLRGEVVKNAISHRNPELGSVLNPKTGIPLSRHTYLHYAASLLGQFKTSELSTDQKQPYYRGGSPWVDHNELIRTNTFIGDFIEEHEAVINNLEMVHLGEVKNTYGNHIYGDNNRMELYSLATVLSLPIIESLL